MIKKSIDPGQAARILESRRKTRGGPKKTKCQHEEIVEGCEACANRLYKRNYMREYMQKKRQG